MGGRISLMFSMHELSLSVIYQRLNKLAFIYGIFAVIALVSYLTPSTAAGWPILFMLILDIVMASLLKLLGYMGPGAGFAKSILLYFGMLLSLGTIAFSIFRMVSALITAFSIIYGLINIIFGIPMVLIFKEVLVKEAAGEGRNGYDLGVASVGLAEPATAAGSYKPPGNIPVAYATYA